MALPYGLCKVNCLCIYFGAHSTLTSVLGVPSTSPATDPPVALRAAEAGGTRRVVAGGFSLAFFVMKRGALALKPVGEDIL